MKVYTKTGDKGKTSLIGGNIVSKSHPRIDAYGNVDELMSFCGMLLDQMELERPRVLLPTILEKLMTIGAILANTNKKDIKLPKISNFDIEKLEEEIDIMDETLEQLTSFILPYGHTLISLTHVNRVICRRVERSVVNAINEGHNIDDIVLKYINRLSDYFFVLARWIGKELKIKDVLWQPKLD